MRSASWWTVAWHSVRWDTAAALALLLTSVSASAQELEPGAYWPVAKAVNIITVINKFNWGDVAFDPSAPIDEARPVSTPRARRSGPFSLGGRLANAGVVVPVIGRHRTPRAGA